MDNKKTLVLSSGSRTQFIKMIRDYFYCNTTVKIDLDGTVSRIKDGKWTRYNGYSWRLSRNRYRFERN